MSATSAVALTEDSSPVSPGILQEEQQLFFTKRGGDKAEPGAEACGVRINRVGQQGAYAGVLCDQQGEANGLHEQSDADAFALVLGRHGQLGQDDHWNRELSHSFAYAVGLFGGVNLAHREAEIPNHPVVDNLHGDKRPG